MGPLYKLGWFDFAYSLQIAGLVGFLFGFVLERAGFGDARKLTAIFYLRDFAVLKVMFTAIVVCVLGLLYFSLFGWIDLSQVYILPTYIWPQIAGGLILGVGFVMGGVLSHHINRGNGLRQTGRLDFYCGHGTGIHHFC